MENDGTRPGSPAREDDGWCFVCGRENPHGLRIPWRLDGDGIARGEFVPGRQHQGWRGVVHGGILSALLDEAMAQRLWRANIRGVTAGLTVRFRQAARVGAQLRIEARLVSERSRSLKLEAQIADATGRVLAEGEGLFLRLSSRGADGGDAARPPTTEPGDEAA